MRKFQVLPRSIKTLIVLVFIGILYWIAQSFVIYTEDAYVTVDSVPVASQVEGRVVAIHVQNDQAVTAGEPLLEIDPTSLSLTQEIAAGNLKDAQETLLVLNSQIKEIDDLNQAMGIYFIITILLQLLNNCSTSNSEIEIFFRNENPIRNFSKSLLL